MNGDDVLKILNDLLKSDLDMDGEGQWDSLNFIEILQEFDEVFEGKIDEIPQQELATMTTPRKVIDLLRKHKLIE